MTNLELLKAIEEGMEIRITLGNGAYGELVEYAPRRKNDRQPWVLRNGDSAFHFPAEDVAAVAPAAATEEGSFLQQEAPATATPEMVAALNTLRAGVNGEGLDEVTAQALVILDNAGVFKEIDAAALHGTARCTCPPLTSRTGLHLTGCLGVTQ